MKIYHLLAGLPAKNMPARIESSNAITAMVKKRYEVSWLPETAEAISVTNGARNTPIKELLNINALLRVSYPLSLEAPPMQIGSVKLMEAPAIRHPATSMAVEVLKPVITEPAVRNRQPITAVQPLKV